MTQVNCRSVASPFILIKPIPILLLTVLWYLFAALGQLSTIAAVNKSNTLHIVVYLES